MTFPDDLGPTYTRGISFRARAEARQREYRANVLLAGWSEHGHLLDELAAGMGRNFVVPEAFEGAKTRAAEGKGVNEKRTFSNMLSSQAMCFNVFSPLARDLGLAATVLRPFFSQLSEVRSIAFEHTPPNSVFGDQSGHGGVDCDLLVDAKWDDGSNVVLTIETKFVEPDFSNCGFRKPERSAKGKAICPDDVRVATDHRLCLYAAKGYRYWQQTARLATLGKGALPDAGCPFGGPEWQLWVNHTLAHAEASARGARHAVFAVCAPAENKILLREAILDRFRTRLANPETFQFLPLDDLIKHISAVTSERPRLRTWADALVARYSGI
jgi:hypothetical protein